MVFEIKANMRFFLLHQRDFASERRALPPSFLLWLDHWFMNVCSSGDIQAVSVAFKGLKNIEVRIFFF